MKLNNKGWGLGFLIVIGCLFLLILIFVSIRIRSLTHQQKKNNNSESTESSQTNYDGIYTSLEGQLQKAGESYAVYHPTLVENTTDHIIVYFYKLKEEGFIESLPDPEADENCVGFVMIKNDGEVKPFIKCNNYKTLNYDLWVEDDEE